MGENLPDCLNLIHVSYQTRTDYIALHRIQIWIVEGTDCISSVHHASIENADIQHYWQLQLSYEILKSQLTQLFDG